MIVVLDVLLDVRAERRDVEGEFAVFDGLGEVFFEGDGNGFLGLLVSGGTAASTAMTAGALCEPAEEVGCEGSEKRSDDGDAYGDSSETTAERPPPECWFVALELVGVTEFF